MFFMFPLCVNLSRVTVISEMRKSRCEYIVVENKGYPRSHVLLSASFSVRLRLLLLFTDPEFSVSLATHSLEIIEFRSPLYSLYISTW